MLDKTGREIQAGDVLRIFHFTHHVRKRKCYLHRLVVEIFDELWWVNIPEIATKKIKDAHKGPLTQLHSEHLEIISSVIEPDGNCWYDRPRGDTDAG